MCSMPILKLPDFTKPIEVECDASDKGMGAVLLQEGHFVAYFSVKLNVSKINYSTYVRNALLWFGLWITSLIISELNHSYWILISRVCFSFMGSIG